MHGQNHIKFIGKEFRSWRYPVRIPTVHRRPYMQYISRNST